MTVKAVDPEVQRQRAGAMWDLHQAWTGRLIEAGVDGPVPPGRKDPSDYNQHVPDMEADGAAMDAFAAAAEHIMRSPHPR